MGHWRGTHNPEEIGCSPTADLGQVIKALDKTIRAMSDGSLDSQVGALGVADGVLDVLVPKPSLQRPCVVAGVG
jgi:hypothetical protein